jgi:hypothetical protein
VRAVLERRYQMINGGLAGLCIQRGSLEKNVGASALQPLANVTRRLGLRRWKMPVENRERIQAIGVRDPANTARGQAGQAPTHIVAAAEFRLFRNEKAKKGTPDISESDQR